MIPATTVVVLFAAILTALGDVQRPTQGHQLGNVSRGDDIILPLTVTQCDPVLIYYNISDDDYLVLADASNLYYFFTLFLPRGVGYFDWICNIPTGYSFFVNFDFFQYYTVQPGSSNACLGDINTTYSYADYFTSHFQSYTQQSPSGNPSLSTFLQRPTVTFPTGSFSTITANPNLVVSLPSTTATAVSSASPSLPTTSVVSSTLPFIPVTSAVSPKLSSLPTTSAVSPTLSSLPTTSVVSPILSSLPTTSTVASTRSTSISTHPHESSKATIAGGVVGGVTLVLLTATVIFVLWRNRRNQYTDATLDPFTAESEPTGFTKSQSGPPYLAIMPPVPPNPAQIICPPEQSAGASSRDTGASLASVLENFTRLTASQLQALVDSLNAADPVAPEASPPLARADSQILMALPRLSTSESTHELSPDIATILDVISRAQSNPRAMAAINNLLMLNQDTPNASSLPPPYDV